MVPAQFPPEGLLATIVFLSETVPAFIPRPPPDWVALLPERVELLTVIVPPWLYMPPPLVSVVLPERVELLTVSVPDAAFHMPPPPMLALLPERVELFTVSVPLLNMPAPALKFNLPLATVMLVRVSFAPLSTSNTRTALLPLTVILALPPSMISPALSVMVNCEPSVMVCWPGRDCSSKLIVSATPLLVLAAFIASRRVHPPEAVVHPSESVVSAVLLTV